jgi:hypothetical protein
MPDYLLVIRDLGLSSGLFAFVLAWLIVLAIIGPLVHRRF